MEVDKYSVVDAILHRCMTASQSLLLTNAISLSLLVVVVVVAVSIRACFMLASVVQVFTSEDEEAWLLVRNECAD